VIGFWALFMVGQFLHRRDLNKKASDVLQTMEPEEKATDFEHDEVVEEKN
jgi:hypothetical protein